MIKMVNLKHLNISHNNLTGLLQHDKTTLCASIFQESLETLVLINALTKTEDQTELLISNIGGLTKLKELHVSDNEDAIYVD